MCCPLVFEFSVGIGSFVIGLGQISFFFSCHKQSWWVKIDVVRTNLGGSRSLLPETILVGQDRCCHKQFWWVKIDVAINSLGGSRSMFP